MEENQKPVTRKIRLNADFAVGVHAEGFTHRFKVIEGIPYNAKIVNLKMVADGEQIELTIQSPTFKPEDEKKLLSLIVHEMAH